jgi:hypothetical protein
MFNPFDISAPVRIFELAHDWRKLAQPKGALRRAAPLCASVFTPVGGNTTGAAQKAPSLSWLCQ